MTASSLPPSIQSWSHSTNSLEKLKKALADDETTAIEADLMMGYVVESNDDSDQASATKTRRIPIMSHPPHNESDLSAARFIQLVYAQEANQQEKGLRKHIKLDFKQIEAVRPTLELCATQEAGAKHDDENSSGNNNKNIFFLNADILPGPGRTIRDIMVPPEEFVQTSLDFIIKSKAKCAFSLGFKVDVCWLWGHTQEQVDIMANLIRKMNVLSQSQGVVLALNARLLAKNMPPFADFLETFPETQILAWTGQGEPPIAIQKVNHIRRYFGTRQIGERVGFDVQTSNWGYLYDFIMTLIGIYKLLKSALTSVSDKHGVGEKKEL